MIGEPLSARLRRVAVVSLPEPGRGETSLRHRRLVEIGCEDLSLARLAEAHWDAVAILAEAGLNPQPGALYGVWASERPGESLRLDAQGNCFAVSGSKPFCSGAGLIDRALVTVQQPEQRLVDIDLRKNAGAIQFDSSVWKTNAFAETNTAAVVFHSVPITAENLIGDPGWYLTRPGFWHGACGPAACWAGGAQGLVNYALQSSRSDPHTLAHLGAMYAAVWALQSYLDSAGREIDDAPQDIVQARIRARIVRHLVEQASTQILQRLPRAYGPHPLALDAAISRRYQELDVYLRQWHAERDLEALGRDVRSMASGNFRSKPQGGGE